MTERTLSAVAPFQEPGEETPEPPTEATMLPSAGIPDFEGKEVHATAAKITSVAGLEIGDQVWRVDDYVRMEVECRVVGVHYVTNDKTHELTRVHVVKAVDSKVLGWGVEPE